MSRTETEAAGAATPQIDGPGAELSTLLRAWRKRLDPADVPGFVQYPRRRKRTLSQGDVAYLAGSTSFWYGELERGRTGGYSDDFLSRVADVLQLSEGEREALHLLAVGRPPVSRFRPSHPVGHAMHRLVATQQYPAYAIDSAFNIVASNGPAAAWFPWLPNTENLIQRVFTDPQARRQFHRWEEEWAPALLAQLRMAHAREPDNATLTRVIRELIASSEEARSLWVDKPTAADPGQAVRAVRLPGSNTPITTDVITCSPLGCAGIRMVILVPRKHPAAEGQTTTAAGPAGGLGAAA